MRRISGKRIADRYCIVDEIGKGGMGVVYRALPFDDPSHSVAIKVIQRSGQLSSEDLLRFQKEAALMSQLYHPNIISFHELGLLDAEQEGEIGSGYYIVMELATGSNLKDTLIRDGRKDLAFFFQIGLQASEALIYTHGKNIIHRDIKPQNIIVSPAWKDQRGVLVKVLDFGVARLAEAMHSAGPEVGAGRGGEEFAGTPLYMAPEQTRLFEAPVDHRVDLYSLGCVLYEILAGKPPFNADTRSKLERQHVFASPEPITTLRPDVPQIVEQIIQKLLAKHPDDRYQTAFGLHADLLRAKSKIDSRYSATGIMFPLGLKDRFQAVSAQLALSGREKELQTLVSGFTACQQERGRSHLTVIRGEPGIGKSRLLAEFRSYLSERKVRFITGSFSQHENALPFNALANAFNDYLLRIFKSNSPHTEELRSKIKNKLGATAQRIAQVVPGLKPFIPEELAAEFNETSVEEDAKGFAKLFSDFTRCLASEEQPLVFMFDNLQWADDKSLELIDEFFSHNNSQRFYMVVSHSTAREVDGSKFGGFIEKFSKLRRRFIDVRLGPLTETAVHEITGNILRSPESVTAEFTSYLYSRSNGNPMYLVELMRQLVTQDYVFLRTKNASWEYDLEEIKKAAVQLQSVDLVINSLQNYDEIHRQLLEVAATIGHTFHFEMLLLEGQKQSLAVMQALQRAIEDGLITRVADEMDLKHLGKTFMFTHKKARDSIYENIKPERQRALHLAIARKLDQAVEEKGSKVIFSLAHHFNASSLGEKGKDVDLAAEMLKYNHLAGRFALQAGSWQSAEKYFENAFQIVDAWPSLAINRGTNLRYELMESLADLAALQRSHGGAVRKYRELLDGPISLAKKYSIAAKTVYLQSVNGYISESVKLCRKFLGTMSQQSTTRLQMARVFFSLAWDTVFSGRVQHRMQNLLKRAYRLGSESREGASQPLIGGRVKLLEALIPLELRQNSRRAIFSHDAAFGEILARRADASDILRVLGERAVIIGYFGFLRAAYRFLDLAIEVARPLKMHHLQGYLLLLRGVFLDYQKPRPGDVVQTMAKSQSLLSQDYDRIVFGVAFVFGMFLDLQRGKIDEVMAAAKRVPDIIPTRNWLSARAHAIAILAHLLKGNRDVIVKSGEQYLRRRAQVHGRSHDLFIEMIRSVVSHAKGEGEKAAEFYRAVMQKFVKGQKEEFLMPFEEDLVGFYALIFPPLFESQNGERLLKNAEMQQLLVSLQIRIKKICGSQRATPALLRARIKDLIGRRDVKVEYDRALQLARVGDEKLVELFSYFWFGQYLIKESGQRTDYLKRSSEIADTLGVKTVGDHVDRILRKGRKPRTSLVSSRSPITGGNVKSIHEASQHLVADQDSLPVRHIKHLSEVLTSRMDINDALAISLEMIAKTYKVGRCFIASVDPQTGQPAILFPKNSHSSEAWLQALQPYFNLRSTLFLPVIEESLRVTSTGSKGEEVEDSQVNQTKDFDLHASFAEQNSDPGERGGHVAKKQKTATSPHTEMDSTMYMEAPGADQHPETGDAGVFQPQPQALLVRSEFKEGDAPLKGDARGRKVMQMSGVVPLRHDLESFGLLVLEQVDLQGVDTMAARRDLDALGIHLGMMLSVHRHQAEVGVAKAGYRPGTFHLEHVSWLNIHTQGTLRQQRETSWYLGLNLSEDYYLLSYANIDGESASREKLSMMLWFQLLASRSLAVSSGRAGLDLTEFRDEVIQIIQSVARESTFHRLVFAFTVFDRNNESAISGHFGSSRPYVLGQENQVSPYNEIVANLANGQELRYWDVVSSTKGDHLYMLTYDSSKFDSEAAEVVRHKMAVQRGSTAAVLQVKDRVQALLVAENIPRYYVAVVHENTNQSALMKTDVAS